MRDSNPVVSELEAALDEIPKIDVHTHLVGGRLGARGLQDILLYHMVISDLYAAGCPTGSRLTQFPGWPDDLEATRRIEEALPFVPRIQNTSSFWGVRAILEDLYGWREPITEENWKRLDAVIRERADDSTWHHSVLDRLAVRRSGTELARRRDGQDDDRLEYSLEWAFFTRCQWAEYDTALYELERCWGHAPQSPTAIGSGDRPSTERTIRSVADVKEAIRWYVEAIPFGDVISTATHLSTDIRYRVVTDPEMAEALSRRDRAGPSERDIYASYVNEALLGALEDHAQDIVFQFSLGEFSIICQ